MKYCRNIKEEANNTAVNGRSAWETHRDRRRHRDRAIEEPKETQIDRRRHTQTEEVKVLAADTKSR